MKEKTKREPGGIMAFRSNCMECRYRTDEKIKYFNNIWERCKIDE